MAKEGVTNLTLTLNNLQSLFSCSEPVKCLSEPGGEVRYDATTLSISTSSGR